MKTIKRLLNSPSDMKLGNHRVEVNGHLCKYIYYQTAICVVDNWTRTFYTDNGGYGTVSTSRAMNAYRRELLDTHKEVTKEEFLKKALEVTV